VKKEDNLSWDLYKCINLLKCKENMLKVNVRAMYKMDYKVTNFKSKEVKSTNLCNTIMDA